jgi:hypothetical protein
MAKDTSGSLALLIAIDDQEGVSYESITKKEMAMSRSPKNPLRPLLGEEREQLMHWSRGRGHCGQLGGAR